MKAARVILLLCALFILINPTVFAQAPYCQNLGFELGNFTNWQTYTWLYSTMYPERQTEPVEGLVSRRHTIISDTFAYDPNTGYELKMVPSGYKYAVRIGDGRTAADESPRNWNQSLRYTMKIDANNTLLLLKFALVLEYDSDHQPIEEPRFSMTLFDANGDTIPDCANYDVFASNDHIKGFKFYQQPDREEIVQWRNWTTVGVNLLPFLGQTITVEFRSADCTLGFDYGYAYFVAGCQPLQIDLKFCTDDRIAVLTAPEGFEEYRWTDSYGNVINTNRKMEVEDPVEGSVYSCKLTSATGCEVTLQTTIYRYSPKVEFGSYMIDCISNQVQLTNNSSSNRGSLLYFWDFGEGDVNYEKEPLHTFKTSGRHTVSLRIVNPPSGCTAILTKEVESFYPPLVDIDGIETYCPGGTVYLKAFGAYYYEWNNGSTADSIEVGYPGGEYRLIGRAKEKACVDTNYFTVSEEPDWDFTAIADTVLCEGDTTWFVLQGAQNYLWNNGDTIDSVMITTEGYYSCIGKNRRGCEKRLDFNARLYGPPEAGFQLSDKTISNRHNEITASIIPVTGVEYNWDMDDGTLASGPVYRHAYAISNYKLFYEVSLLATSQYGCINTYSDIIEVIPFVPNVFSPNGDGINDVFMAGIEIEIFDRYGLVLFKGSNGWDGIYNGKPVDPDTYFYSLYYEAYDGRKNSKKGYLTLVR